MASLGVTEDVVLTIEEISLVQNTSVVVAHEVDVVVGLMTVTRDGSVETGDTTAIGEISTVEVSSVSDSDIVTCRTSAETDVAIGIAISTISSSIGRRADPVGNISVVGLVEEVRATEGDVGAVVRAFTIAL